MRRAWALCALFLVSPVAAQTEGVIGVTRVIEHPVAVAEMLLEWPDDSQAGCATPAGDHLYVIVPDTLRFDDGFDEQACAFALYRLEIPPGATGYEVRFKAARSSASLNDGFTSAYTSAVWAYAPEALSMDFFRREEVKSDVRAFSMAGDLGPQQRQLNVGWTFADVGASPLPQQDPIPPLGSQVAGTAATIDVIRPLVRFRGIPAIGDVTVQQTEVTRDRVEQHVRVEGVVNPGESTELVFRVQNSLSIHHVQLPDGRRLSDAALVSGEVGGILELRLPVEVTQAYGPGTYVAVFSQFTALEPTPLLIPIILGLLIVPLPLGIFATRGAIRFQAKAVGRFVTTARSLRLALAFWWAVYVAALGIVALGRMWPLIVAWPLQVQAALVHGAFVLVALVFIALGFLWRRQLSDTMEAELAEKERVNRDLARSNQELQQFAYVASHDLQEPLRTVARFTQLLERRYADQLDDQAKEFMAFSVDGAKRMQALIDGLLELSRVETRGRPLVPTEVTPICDRVIRSLQARIDESKAKVTRGDLPTVLGDELQLGQLLQNLIGNALKFRDPKRRLLVHVDAQRDGAEWRFSVKDNGIGIEAKHFERIFVIFQRLHARDEYEGTGMGLALCKKIVDRHGGRIWVESMPGKGSTFYFTLIDPKLSKPSKV